MLTIYRKDDCLDTTALRDINLAKRKISKKKIKNKNKVIKQKKNKQKNRNANIQKYEIIKAVFYSQS
jgi:hypothetical protein